MSHAEVCPICYGKGWVALDGTENLTCPSHKTCHGCGGMGWVTVGADAIFPETREDGFIEPHLLEFYRKKGYTP
jgi:hypothetical protein